MPAPPNHRPDPFPQVMAELDSLASEHNRQGMARYGINVERALGISVRELRRIAKPLRRSPELAARLWATGIHEARILACLVDDPATLTRERAESLAEDFDSWDVCDACCANLLDKTGYARDLALALAARPETFVRRAGFSLMAALAVHDKKAPDSIFLAYLGAVESLARDPRNFVKKAVNWALRQIGKRNLRLHAPALLLAERLARSEDKNERWVGKDAARELTNPKILARLQAK